MNTTIVKRSLVIGGHKTSISLEDGFWLALKDIAWQHQLPVQDLVAQIDKSKDRHNLSSAVRLFVLAHYRGR